MSRVKAAIGPTLPVLAVSALLCLGIANIVARASWRELDDGVLWRQAAEGVVVSEIAEGTPAARVGLRAGDVLLAIADRPIQHVADVVQALHAAEADSDVQYTLLRLGAREVINVQIAPIATGSRSLYFLLAGIGIFTLVVGGAVRLRRPRDQVTLHFLWLSVAFFGVFTFSFSGRLDRLDWVFYWGDVISMLLLPPLFLHFTLVFPERPQRWAHSTIGRALIPAIYAPAAMLGAVRVTAFARSGGDAAMALSVVATVERLELAYLAVCVVGGIAALARAVEEVRSLTARRQLRWIAWGGALGVAPFACGYALPYAAGAEPSLKMGLSAIPLSLIPLAYASAIVRYRLMDIEVIVKRVLAYAAAVAAIVVIYVVLLQGLERILLADQGASHDWVIAFLVTCVALLLAPPVKTAIQNAVDRMFYRDRYDYRRALVGFARDLNSDLDLARLSERLVSRVVETLSVDRMALLLEDGTAAHFGCVRSVGFVDRHPPVLAKSSAIGARLVTGHRVALDDSSAAGRFAAEDVESWREAGTYYFVPCVAEGSTIAVLVLGRRDTGAPLTSEDLGLLSAVAGQIATALENARLYRQLHVKALEHDRLRTFNENILESLNAGLLVLDLEDRIVRWNRALEQLYGVDRSDAIGAMLSEVVDAPFVETIRASRRDTPDGTTFSRVPLTTRGGRTVTVNAAVVPLRATEGGEITTAGTIVILDDVTERVQLEEQLRISEKMASIGLLAAGVAHEVNTPLTGISTYTQMLLDDADPADAGTRLLEKIERQTFRAAKIVSGLLNLSRPAPSSDATVSRVDLNDVVNDVLSLLEHQFELHRIKVRREISTSPVVVQGFEHKLQQVFLNLFLNAKDAMPRGGWLSITTRVDGDRAVAEVADTGSGIPNEYLARIYDPFFTTKTIGQGTGLGLSITYGIVREHEGSIECESVVGHGTRFTISFRAEPAVRVARSAHR